MGDLDQQFAATPSPNRTRSGVEISALVYHFAYHPDHADEMQRRRRRRFQRLRLMAPRGVEPLRADSKSAALPLSYGASARVADGTRTRDHRDHNPGLYQLSYRHHAAWTG
jgi:hypothetical protein